MEPWKCIILQGVLASLAPSTRRAYDAAVSHFLAFTQSVGRQNPWPVGEVMVLQYLAHLRELGLAHKTMRQRMAAISFFSKAQGFSDPCQTFLARRALEGWKRCSPQAPDSRRPITLSMLQGFISQLPHICTSSYEAALFGAAFSLAFFGAFRCSELISASRQDTSGRAIAITDVLVDGTRLVILLRRSKTDQYAKGARIVLHAAPKNMPCPVRLTKLYLSVRPKVAGPLMVHKDGSCLSRYQFVSILRICLTRLGFPAQDFGGHSFRIGAATYASVQGFDSDQIMAIGRWRSSAYKLYVRPGLVY